MFMKGGVMVAQHFMRHVQECAAECACTSKNKQNKKQPLAGAEPKVHRHGVKTVPWSYDEQQCSKRRSLGVEKKIKSGALQCSSDFLTVSQIFWSSDCIGLCFKGNESRKAATEERNIRSSHRCLLC